MMAGLCRGVGSGSAEHVSDFMVSGNGSWVTWLTRINKSFLISLQHIIYSTCESILPYLPILTKHKIKFNLPSVYCSRRWSKPVRELFTFYYPIYKLRRFLNWLNACDVNSNKLLKVTLKDEWICRYQLEVKYSRVVNQQTTLYRKHQKTWVWKIKPHDKPARTRKTQDQTSRRRLRRREWGRVNVLPSWELPVLVTLLL